MNIRKLGDKKPNVVLFQGSPRDKETCSGMDSKTEVVVNYLVQECDAFIIVSPIHWHSLTSQIKTLFDRLVCINLTMDVWDAIKGVGYYTANLTVMKNRELFERADQLMDNLLNYLNLSGEK